MFISGDPGLPPFFCFRKYNYLKGLDNCMLFSHARGALIFYLNKLKSNENRREVLLPDYICDDLVRAIKSADFEVTYYNIDVDLKPEEANILERITDKTLAILFVHYFGFF